MDQETRSEFAQTNRKIVQTNQKMDREFAKTNQKIDKRFEQMDSKFENLAKMIKAGFDNTATKEDLKNYATKKDLRIEINKHKLETQDFISDKMADFKSDMLMLTRKEDDKLFCLVDKLGKKKIISRRDIAQLGKMKPFPRTVA
ncbi:MAG: hypothetical protein HQ530_02455 [Parcubacteria group bacterium]|nr:hypothetical protein [Parcubacteria group bacterium]